MRSPIIKSYILRMTLQIVHWKNHLKFTDDPRFSPEAKDITCRLL